VLSSQMKQKHEDLEAVFETESCKTSIELLMGLTEENQAHGKLTRTFGNKWLMIEVRNKPEKKQVIYAETERGERQAGHVAFNLDFWKRQPTIRRKISSDHE
jgi:DNA polymerase III sliding clamp (beta) subunit (PCNA family)